MKVLVRPLFQGVKRLAFLPFLSLPIILTLGFTLGALLSITALVSTLFLKPLPGIKDDANLHTVSLQLLIGNGMSLNFWDWRRSAHFEQYFTDVGSP